MYKKVIHEEIFSLCYYGQGGFQHNDIYTMPIHLRKFYIKQLIDTKKQENDAYKKHRPGMKK